MTAFLGPATLDSTTTYLFRQTQAEYFTDHTNNDGAPATEAEYQDAVRSKSEDEVVVDNSNHTTKRGQDDIDNVDGRLQLKGRNADQAKKRGVSNPSTEKRPCGLQLPSFKNLGLLPLHSLLSTDSIPSKHHLDGHAGVPDLCLPHCTSHGVALVGGSPPLTPPLEDMPRLQPILGRNSAGRDVNSRSNPTSESSQQESDQTARSTNAGFQETILPRSSSLLHTSQIRKSSWITTAIRHIVTLLSPEFALHEIQIVSHTLPSQAIDSRSQPTFEEVLQVLQTELDPSPYVTITHAVPPARVMDEIPKTPPTTPGLRREVDDYFGSDQTIFTHAAVVPIYHAHGPIETTSTNARASHHIAAPCSIQVSVLERYIPPTMSSEIEDFFSASPRSYLADRLSELSVNHGSLLLIYPTLAGGRTFARRYIGPVIDPYLRQFVLLNNLTSDAAARMGEMLAVNDMLDFEEMQRRVQDLCRDLSTRPAVRGHRSAYRITHANTADVMLDRETWMNWFVEQEQSRLRQNLVEYHQSGGRMPTSTSHREVTVGMLARDVIDGLQKSAQSAGDVGIEVGVIVITRSASS